MIESLSIFLFTPLRNFRSSYMNLDFIRYKMKKRDAYAYNIEIITFQVVVIPFP